MLLMLLEERCRIAAGTTNSRRLKQKRDRLARPSLVAGRTADNDIRFVGVYLTGVPTLRDEMPH